MKRIRFDLYYGYSDNNGPIDCTQLYFDINEDIQDIKEATAQRVEEIIGELTEGDDNDEGNESTVN